MKLRALALSVLMVMSVVAVGVSFGPGVATAAGNQTDVAVSDLPGSGTSNDPYQISSASELQAIEDDLGAHYTLVADVNASDTSEWNDGAGFAPIGDSGTPFTGTFDGNGYTIADLTINRSSENNVGLFGYTGSSAVIANVSIEDIDVTGYQYVGGLVGYSSGTMDSSYATGNVSATGNTVGGLVGYGEGTVGSSYATGNVSATGNTVGGLIGTNFGTVDSSYATGTVTGQDRVGGLIGANLGTVTDAYWDVNTTGQSDTNDGYDDAGTGLTTTQLKANTSLDGFDFTNTWAVKTGGEVSYPYLLNNTQSPAPGLESLFAGGNGTAANPYQIGDWNDLDSVRNALDANFTLVADLNSSTAGYDSVASPSANNDKGFEPIGSSSTRFNGTFNGSGYKLADLVINRPDSRNVSIFGVVGSSGTVTLTGVENASVTGGTSVGGLVGYNAGMVNLSYTTGSVRADDSGNQSGSSVGGLVGNLTGDIRNAYSMSDVTGTTTVGGLVGNISKNFGTRTKYTYATGKVSSTVNATVRGHAGGVLEYGQQQIAYFDQKTTGVTERVGNPYPRHTGQLKGYEGHKEFFHKEYETQDVFDSQNIWTINNSDGVVSYPYLQQNPQTDIPGKEKLYSAGNGTSGQPYEVANWTHLNDTRQNPSANFTLTANLSRESGGYRKEVTNPSGGFTPINGFGSGAGSEFKGRFDGAGNTITDLVINRNSDFVGLFGISSGTISKISIKNVSISGDRGVGGVVGLQVHPELGGARTIKNVSVTGEVNGTSFVGGVAGQIYLDTVRDTNASVNVTGETAVGGLVGSSAAGKITDSNVDGRVTGGTYVGGLVGAVGTNGRFFNNRGSIQASTTDVSVTGNSSVGGMVGANGGTSIPAVYYEGKINHLPLNGTEMRALEASGSVQSPRNVGGHKIGGLVGQLYRANVTRSSATGEVQGRLNSGDVQAGNATKIGGLVGYMSGTNAVLKRSVAVGNVTGSSNVGGLVGANGNASAFKKGGTIENATASGTVTLAGDSTDPENLGGLVGQIFQGTVTQSNATGNVNAGDATNVGGLVGYNDATEPSTIRETYATGAVDGGNNVGGLVGKSVNDLVTESYAIGSVNGSASVGGLVGNNTGSIAKVNNSYAAGSVTGDSAGGLVGTIENGASVTDAYWDTQTTNQSSSAGNATGLTTSQLKANTSLAFDFETTWAVKTGVEKSYPYLLKNTQSPAPGLESLFPGGDGTEASPYQIADWNDLDNVRDALDANYTLVADLDENTAGYDSVASASANNDKGFDPFGDRGASFSGTFDGQDHTIANLTINRTDRDYVALFGRTGGGMIVNVSLEDVEVTGNRQVGSLVGSHGGGVVSASSATGTVDGSTSVGGLVGDSYGRVSNSTAAVSVTGSEQVGGLVGLSSGYSTSKGIVNTSHATGTVDGTSYVGGLVGRNYDGGGVPTVKTSSATGSVNGSDYVGGLIGGNSGETKTSNASGTVTGSESVGGLVGANGVESDGTSGGSIEASNASGEVALNANVRAGDKMGGLVGQLYGGSVTRSNATGDISGGFQFQGKNIGGLVGYADGTTSTATITDSYAVGDALGDKRVGGLVGTAIQTEINRTYATGGATGTQSNIGGLVGNATGTNTRVSNSYAVGSVTGNSPVGGLIGTSEDGASVTDAYWDLNTTGQDTSAGGTGLTTSELKGNESLAGFTFTNTWGVRTGGEVSYPYLLNTTQSPAPGLESLFAGGSGTEADPYELSSPDTLGSVSSAPNASYELTADLDMAGVSHDPIGTAATPFNGSFDGNGYTIANLTIDRPGEDNVGLFGHVATNGTVANVTIENATVTGDSNVGGLVGETTGTITGSSVTGRITGNESVGGLAGANGVESDDTAGGTIESSTASATVTVNASATAPTQFGGLVGQNYQGTVTTSNATGDVQAGDATSVGGLVGYTSGTGASAVVNVSYATGNVTGSERVGGIAGTTINATITQTYATGGVNGSTDLGGLVGNVTGRNSEVVYAYAVGPVTGNSSVGGLVGTTTDNPRVANSYWDVETTGQDNSAGLREFSGRTTAEMTGPSVRGSLGLFDFDATWDVLISNGTVSYPSLRANPQEPAPGKRTLYADGNGTADNPYEIENWYHLDATRENPRANYTLVADLDPETAGYDSVAAPSANGGHGFDPIGADRRGFEGEFDGEGHTITNLTIDRPGEDTVGLFAIVPAGQYADGTVKNLRLSNVDITGARSVGGVAGFHGQAAKTIANVSVSGTVDGTENVGGVVGTNLGLVENLTATATVNGSTNVGGLAGSNRGIVTESDAAGTVSGSTNVGGLVGANELGTVRDSNAMGDVTGDSTVGGLLGTNNGGLVTGSYGTGNVTVSGDNAGGLIGWNTDYSDWSGVHNATVTNTYATGDVSAKGGNVGGLLGNNTVTDGGQSVINNSYAVGAVSGYASLGGLVGTNNATVENAYWDTETTGLSDSDGGIGLTTSQLKANTSLAFDFGTTWDVETGSEVSYPYLLNNTQSPAPGLETIDTTSPSISTFSVTNPSDQDVQVSFDTSEQLSTIEVTISGAESATLMTGEFSETDNSDGTYTYTATHAVSTDGDYTATLTAAADAAGNDGASGESGNVTIDVTPPTIDSFAVSNPSGQDVQVAFNSTEQLSTVEVSITGAESTTLTSGDFTATASDGTYTYEAIHAGNSDGTYIATLETATDDAGNDGASNQSGSVEVDTADDGGSGGGPGAGDMSAPSISGFEVTNQSGQNVHITFVANEQVSTISVAITGAESATLATSDFSETDNGDGTYSYTATYAGSTDGTYTATLTRAEDHAGNDGASGQSGSVTVDVTQPSISGFEVTNPSEQAVRVAFDADEQLATVEVTISGAENTTLATSDFSKIDNGDSTYTYEATYEGSTDGNYTATLKTATDDLGNDGANAQSETVIVDTTAPSISGFAATNPSGQDVRVTFDADEQLSTLQVAITGPESATLATSDFSETDNGDGTYTYEATYAGSTDGTYTAALSTAADDADNDGASGQSDTVTIDVTAPSISGFAATNPSGQDVRIAFDASEQLSTIDVSITGAESATLTESDVTETANGDDTYTYEATYAGSTDGTYEVTLETATDDTDNDGASGQSATVQVDTDEDDGDTTTDEDDGDTTTDEDDGDTATDEDDGDTTDAERKPSGETNPGETWVEPSELQEVRIVDVRLETAPANSVKTTNIVTLENPFQTERSVDVRFVIDGDVVGEREVSVPAEQRINATQSMIVEESGTHEVAANVATKGDDGGTVRTFDFMIGTLELDDNGDEIASSSADPPGQRDTDELTAEDGTDDDGGSGVSPLVVVGIIVLVALVLVGVYVRRRSGS
ncbi:GLUG domain protein [Halorhabdus utahensis DSM 12940]|uniref:GLUG domain protein n=2 Tax=Halorhabdus utahensis TaxID=146826 RepID=C7NU02_HALUD|nr:GLUG domain protein [Halorhabdus utahensis DSM 12940]